MTNDEVWSAAVRWIASRTGRRAIQSHQSGRVPSLPYVMVNMTGVFEVRQHEQDIEFDGTATVTATPVIETEWRFSVHAYGPNPTDILRPIVSAVKLGQVQEPLLPGLVVHDISQIRNVPDWINNGWEPRAQMDFNLRGLTRDGHVIDVIEDTTFDIDRA